MRVSNSTRKSSEQERAPGYGIQIGFVAYRVSIFFFFTNSLYSYRTLSIRVEEKALPSKAKASADPADAIASIDVHLISTDEVFTRYSCHPTVGLEQAAVLRKSNDSKNVISPPPTQHWKKILNYIFGGFNFLMWIAFVVTTVRFHELYVNQSSILFSSSRTSPWEEVTLPSSTLVSQFCWYVGVYFTMIDLIYTLP